MQWLVQRFRSERLRLRSRRSATFTPSAHVRRQFLPVWPPTLNKIPLPLKSNQSLLAINLRQVEISAICSVQEIFCLIWTVSKMSKSKIEDLWKKLMILLWKQVQLTSRKVGNCFQRLSTQSRPSAGNERTDLCLLHGVSRPRRSIVRENDLQALYWQRCWEVWHRCHDACRSFSLTIDLLGRETPCKRHKSVLSLPADLLVKLNKVPFCTLRQKRFLHTVSWRNILSACSRMTHLFATTTTRQDHQKHSDAFEYKVRKNAKELQIKCKKLSSRLGTQRKFTEPVLT